MYRQEAVEILVEQTEFLYLNDDEGIPRHVRIALDTLKWKKEDSIYKHYFALTEGRLIKLGEFGTWTEAAEYADDVLGECGWEWVANYYDVKQWSNCIQEVENEYLLSK